MRRPAGAQGVAAALIEAGAAHVRAAGARELYVHVIAANAAGVQLYAARCGFAQEQAESEGIAPAAAPAPGRPSGLRVSASGCAARPAFELLRLVAGV